MRGNLLVYRSPQLGVGGVKWYFSNLKTRSPDLSKNEKFAGQVFTGVSLSVHTREQGTPVPGFPRSLVQGPFLGDTPVPGSFPGPFRGGAPVPGSFSGHWSQVLSGGTPVLAGSTPVVAGGTPVWVLPQARTGITPNWPGQDGVPLSRPGLRYPLSRPG